MRSVNWFRTCRPAFLSVLAALLIFGASAWAATIEVSGYTPLTNNARYDRNPSISYDGTSLYWLLYTKGDNASTSGVRGPTYDPDADTYVVYYKYAATIAGLKDSTEKRLAKSEDERPVGFDQRVVTAVMLGNDIYAIVSSGQSGTNRQMYYYKRTLYPSPGSWSSPQLLTTATGGHVNAVSDGSTIYIVWESSDGSSDFYTFDGTTLSSKVDISADNQPKITRAGSTLYVVSIEDGTGDIEVRSSMDSGSTWNPVSSPAIAGAGLYDPCIFSDGTDLYVITAPYVPGNDQQYLIQAKYSGGVWSTAKTVSLGGYGTTYWWDYWPVGYWDGADQYVFFSTETSSPTYSDGEIGYIKMDWDLGNDHYFYVQNAVNQASSGDEVNVAVGTYAENVTVNKKLTLDGAGSGAGGTVITPLSGLGMVITASGSSALDRLVVKDLRITGASTNGIDINAPNASYLTFDNVACVSNGGSGINTNPPTGSGSFVDIVLANCDLSSNVGSGLRSASYVGINGLTVTGGHMDGNRYGWYDAHGSGNPIMTDVVVTGTTFSNDWEKGIYVESLDRATFTGITANSSGTAGSYAAGIDINLKYEDYQDIIFDYPVITNCGTGDAVNGAGITVKARDDGGYASDPATLNNVQITSGVFSGNQEAIRFGEVGTANNAGPTNVTVSNCSITGSVLKEIRNLSQAVTNASGNWWGSSVPATVATKVTALKVDYTPWLAVGTDMGDPGFQGNFSELWVDDDSPQTGAENYVQEAVDVVTGSTINLAAGTYTGQVKMTGFSSLDLVGTGVGATIVKAPATAMPHYFTTGSNNNYPILFCDNSTVDISDLTVDGDGKGNSNYRFVGVGFWNSSGSLTDVDVVNVRDTPFSGAQHGVAVYAYNSGSGPYTIAMTDVNLSGFQKNGTALTGSDLTLNLTRVHATGIGDTPVTAQNGIQIGYGAGGTINDCDVSNVSYTGATWTASGFLLQDGASTTISGGCTATGCQTSLYATDTDGSFGGIISAGSSSNEMYGVIIYNSSFALAERLPKPQAIEEAWIPDRTLDADQTFSVTNSMITGMGLAGSVGIYGYSDGDNLTLTVDDCDISGWDNGIYVQEDGGTISPATITDNRLSNTNNTHDNHTPYVAGRWAENCYSDFGSNSGFPTEYRIPDGTDYTQKDLNPNTNDCGNVDFLVSSVYVGCPAGCEQDTLYLTFDQIGFIVGQIFVQLPAGLDADWLADGTYPGAAHSTYPAVNAADNLLALSAQSRRFNDNGLIEVNMSWSPPYSTGNPTQYIACIPLVNSSSTHGQELSITGAASTFYDASGAHVDEFTLGSTTITVDCDPPTAELSGGGGETDCNAYNSEAEFLNAIAYSMSADGPPNSPLDYAYIKLGTTEWTVPVTGGTFPTGSESPNVWDTMIEGCNTFVLHAFDTECNEGTSTLADVVKDLTAPTIAGSPFYTQSACYNNISSDPQYGATKLDTDMDIDVDAPGSCQAATVSLKFTLDATTYTARDHVGSVTDYPDATQAQALWDWIVSVVGTDYSGTANITVTVEDCAGNATPDNISMCMDFVPPGNTFTEFDARPTHLGIWLKWQWTYDAAQAVEVEIYRAPEGDYPLYASELWNSDANYEKDHGSLGSWTLVATQVGPNSTSTVYSGRHAAADPNYWLDSAATWVDANGSADRDIYRYVTFVKDNGGNWSAVSSYDLNVNADRSTNYWLGDYSADGPNPTPYGWVNSVDLNMLSGVYFTTVVPGTEFYDIGPENHENGIGKGIPTPDTNIDFLDLVPFSFNFGVAAPGGFNVRLPETKPFSGLDAEPVVSASCGEDLRLSVGDEFMVTVALSGNAQHAVKVAEAQLHFDPEVLELVSATEGEIEVVDGVPFVLTRRIEGCENAVGIAAAALGEIACMAGDFALASIEFRWIGEQTSTAEIELTAIQLADGHGNVIEGAGTILTINGTGAVPDDYALHQNYPNPFNPTTRINFDLPEASQVRLAVFNLLGQEVRTLVAGQLPAGRHFVAWDGRDASGHAVSSGLYLYRLQAGDFVSSRKMLLTR